MAYEITGDCIGCGACARKCPEQIIEGERKEQHHIDPFLCSECGTCFETCKQGAIINPQGIRSPKKTKKGASGIADIDRSICAGCRNCYLNCPEDAISVVKKGFFSGIYCQVDKDECSRCGNCTECCITGAVKLR